MVKEFKNRAWRTRRRRLVMLGLLLLLIGCAGAGGWLATSADGKNDQAFSPPASPPPAPKIVPTPSASPTTLKSISFVLSDSQSGVTYACSLDGAPFVGCASPKPYSALGDGAHTFRAEAIAGSKTSSATSYGWQVDTVPPPTPSIDSGPLPHAPGAVSSTSATFKICDDADNDGDQGCDSHDLSRVALWCSLDATAFKACSSAAGYNHLGQGSHTFKVYAVDLAGNQSEQATWTWIVDTVKPTVTLTATPPDPSPTATATFGWAGSDPAPGSGIASYRCSRENGQFTTCPAGTPPYTFSVNTSNNGQHQFAVEAVDNAGNVSDPADYKWKVAKGSALNFTISGNAQHLLYPGALAEPLNLAFNNPNVGSLSLSSLSVAITKVDAPHATGQHPCTTSDYAVTQYSGTYPITIPPGSSTLQSDGIAQSKLPTVKMVETHKDQDGCAFATVTLTYTGSAQG